MQTKTLYDTDIVAWADQTAQLLQERRFDEVDLEYLIEEVEDLGGRHRDALESNLEVLLMHLLKWQYQPGKQTSSWRLTILEHRRRIKKQCRKMPSLKRHLEDCWAECYADAVEAAADETGLDIRTFPSTPQWSTAEVLDKDWFPSS